MLEELGNRTHMENMVNRVTGAYAQIDKKGTRLMRPMHIAWGENPKTIADYTSLATRAKAQAFW
eukprot:3086115-Heterocapsa_arctica.AAC.1